MKIYLIIFILAIFLIPFLLPFLIKEIPNDSQPSLEGTQMIDKDAKVTQFFISNMENLSGFGMSIKNPYYRNKKELELKIYDVDKILIRKVSINGINVPDGDFIILRFDPIKDSKDKRFSFELSAPDAESSESLEIFLSPQKRVWLGDLYLNNKKVDGVIPFVAYHKVDSFSTVIAIFTQVTQRLFKDLPFTVFYTVLIGVLAGYLVYSRKAS